MTVQELKDAFSIYFNEIDRCEQAKCYWALLHILLAIPDICASLDDKYREVGDGYVYWCDAYIPKSTNISSSDRYQMRNSLFHSGSSSVKNKGKKHQSSYFHFSFIDPDSFDVSMHDTIDASSKILNVHIKVMVEEIKQALENWFYALQKDQTTMATVQSKINFLSRSQPKKIIKTEIDGSTSIVPGITNSST